MQDGYTLERVNVYGLIDGVHETVVISGAECYVGRNDNPSFSQSVWFFLLTSLFLTQRFIPSKKKKFTTRSRFSTLVGSEPLDALSNTIWHASGPSGPNKVRF